MLRLGQAGNGEEIVRLGLVKRTGPDDLIDFVGGEPIYLSRGAGAGEEPAGGYQRGLVARADRKDAGDDLLEDGGITFFRQLKERGAWKGADCRANAANGAVDVEGALGRTGTDGGVGSSLGAARARMV
jgi:hypothetical protein